MKAVIYFYLM